MAVILLIFMFTTHVQAEEASSPLLKLDAIADQALQLTKLNRPEEAKQLLEYFSKEFSSTALQDKRLSMDEIRILTVSHHQALKSVVSTTAEPIQRVQDVTAFRLVMDAISSQYEPLWTEMEEPIMSAFQQMKAAAESKNHQSYQASLNTFLTQYNIIQPSLRVDVPVEMTQAMDAKIQYIDQYRNQLLEKGNNMEQFDQLEDDLQHLFDSVQEDEADPSLWWVIITTGSIIISTLSYVGWRKYKGEKEEKSPKKLND